MSNFSASASSLVQLASRTVQCASHACGDCDDITRQVSNLHEVLEHLSAELAISDAKINKAKRSRRIEIHNYLKGCEENLRPLYSLLRKYDALGQEERAAKKIKSKIRLKNGEIKELSEIRSKISLYTTAIQLSLNIVSLESRGQFERQMSRQDGDLKGIRQAVNLLLAKLATEPRQGSIFTIYSSHEKGFWKAFRQDLAKAGYSKSVTRDHKDMIMGYVKEMEARGILNKPNENSRVSQETDVTPKPIPSQLPLPTNIAEAQETPSFTIQAESESNEESYLKTPECISEPAVESVSTKSPYAVQIEEVIDEAFAPQSGPTEAPTLIIEPDTTPDLTEVHTLEPITTLSMDEDLESGISESAHTPPGQSGQNDIQASPPPSENHENTEDEEPFPIQDSLAQELAPLDLSSHPNETIEASEDQETATDDQHETIDDDRLEGEYAPLQSPLRSRDSADCRPVSRRGGEPTNWSDFQSISRRDSMSSDFLPPLDEEEQYDSEEQYQSDESQSDDIHGSESLSDYSQSEDGRYCASECGSLFADVKNKNFILFTDAVGRQFSFPLWIAGTWQVCLRLKDNCRTTNNTII